MKRRFADARGNKDIINKEFHNYYINNDDFKGNISILKLNEVKQKWIVDEENRCILDNNYIWIEVYPDDKNFCITVMCDENLNTKEWYFDICKRNGIEEGVPYEDDLYLDIVIVPDGRMHILDEDELQEAYENKIITEDDIDLANKTKDIIIKEFGENIPKLRELTENYKDKLLRKKDKDEK
ncbi:MAG: DUF402 domain-containing protein [Clostridia bacterium]|nr:DUF402 domain-containing protein [Clostridia bacterium]